MKQSVESKVEKFFSQFSLKSYKKGQIIIQPNKNPSTAYFIKSGFVKIYGISNQGVETIIHLFSSNSFFPMMWIIGDIPNRFYYEALTPVELFLAPKEKTVNFLKQNQDVLLDFTTRLLSGLDKLTLRIEQLSYEKAATRIVSILLFLNKHFGIENNNSFIISEIFTHKDIASFAGLTRETTSREMKKLEDKKLISHWKSSIVINDLKNLEREISLV